MAKLMDSIYLVKENSHRDLVLFIGSGISVSSPSSLPSDEEAIESLLNLDWVDGDEKFPLSDIQLLNPKLKEIRFEHLLSVFQEWGKHDINSLLGQFADAEPNPYHFQIAKLCRERVVKNIITTNFDSCIEKALTQLDVQHNPIVYSDDVYVKDSSVTNIFKIHGSVSKQGATYNATSLITTLESLSRGLPYWKEELFLEILNTHTCIFVGYSGSDFYDINPVLFDLHEKHLFWVARRQVSSIVAKIISDSIYSKPLIIDPAIFLSGKPLPRRTEKFKFRPTYDLNHHFHPSVFVGRVLETVNDYSGAQAYYEMVGEKSTLSKYWMTEMLNITRSNAVCHYELGNYDAAQWLLFEAKTNLANYIDRVIEDGGTPKSLTRRILLDQLLLLEEEQALVSARLGKQEEAFEHMEMALNCLSQMEIDEQTKISIRSRLIFNKAAITLEIITQNPSDFTLDEKCAQTIEDLQFVCAQKRKSGNFQGLTMSLGLLGQCLLLLRKEEEAGKQFIEMYSEIQRFRTPIRKEVLDISSEVLGYLVCSRHSEKQKSFELYLRCESETKTKLETYIKDKLIDHVYNDWEEALATLCENTNILQLINQLQKEMINQLQKEIISTLQKESYKIPDNIASIPHELNLTLEIEPDNENDR